MFSAQQARVRERQLALRLRSAELRAAIVDDVQAFRPVLRWGERGLSAWAWMQAMPVPLRLLPAVALALLLRRPARALRWTGLALSALRWARLIRQALR